MAQPTIRELRKQLGLTQQKLAELCGFNSAYISQIESGKRKMSQRSERIIFAELEKLLNQGPTIAAGTINAQQVVGGLHNVAHLHGDRMSQGVGTELEKKLDTICEDIADVKTLLVKILGKIG